MAKHDEFNNYINEDGNLIDENGKVIGEFLKTDEKTGFNIYVKKDMVSLKFPMNDKGKLVGIDEKGKVEDKYLSYYYDKETADKIKMERSIENEEQTEFQEEEQQQQQTNSKNEKNKTNDKNKTEKGILGIVGGGLEVGFGGAIEVVGNMGSTIINDEYNQLGTSAIILTCASVTCPPVAIGAGIVTGVNFLGKLVAGDELSLGTLADVTRNTIQVTNIATKQACKALVKATDLVKIGGEKLQEIGKETINSNIAKGEKQQDEQQQERE